MLSLSPRTDEHSESGVLGAASDVAGVARGDARPGHARRIETPSGQLSRVRALLERAEDEDLALDRRLRLLALSSRCLDSLFEGADPAAFGKGAPRESDQPDIRAIVERQEAVLFERLLPALGRRGAGLCAWEDLAPSDRRKLDRIFAERIFPVLTPLRVGPAHPSPRLASLVLQVGVLASDGADGEHFFARIEIPTFLPRFLPVEGSGGRSIALEELVIAKVGRLLPGAIIESAGAFRVTRSHRSADHARPIGASGPLPPRGAPVRLECDRGLAPGARQLILRALDLDEADLILRRSPIDLGVLDALPLAPAEGLPGGPESPRLRALCAPSPPRSPRSS